MGITDSLRAAGFKPEASTEGEYKALKGTYECSVAVLRPEIDSANGDAKFYQLELTPVSVIEGDNFGPNTSFRKRYYVDGEKAAENLKKLVNTLFTAGIELPLDSDEAFEAGFGEVIGKKIYVRTWGWKPEGKDSEYQMFNAIKEGVAEKKRSSDSVGF